MNLQSVIDNARGRRHEVEKIKTAILDLDQTELEEVFAHIADLITPKVVPRVVQNIGELRERIVSQKRIVRAEKGVKTRKLNTAAKSKTPLAAKTPMAPRMKEIVDYVTAHPSAPASQIALALKMKGASKYLTEAKHAKRLYNEAGKWYPTVRQKGHDKWKHGVDSPSKSNGAI